MFSVFRLLTFTLLSFPSFSSCSTVYFDDTDPAIVYSNGWQKVGGPTDRNGTLALSSENAVTATLKFTGTSVVVYGALAPVGTWNMHSLYYVDGALAGSYTPDSVVATEQHQAVFFSTSFPTSGTHTLEVENAGQQFRLDFIAVSVPGAGDSITTKPVAATAGLTPPITTSAHTSPTTTSSPTTIVSPPSTSSSSNTKSTSASTITTFPTTSASSSISFGGGTTSVPGTQRLPISSATSSPVSISSAQTSSGPSFGSPAPSTSVGAASGSAVARKWRLSLGVIIGIVVGGVAGLALASALVLAAYRRIRARRSAVTPFVPNRELDDNPAALPVQRWRYEKLGTQRRQQQDISEVSTGRRHVLIINHGEYSGGVWASLPSTVIGTAQGRASTSHSSAV